MKTKAIMALVGLLVLGVGVAHGELLTFESYADNAAWDTAGSDGFVSEGEAGDKSFDLEVNPLKAGINTSDKVVHLYDASSGAKPVATKAFDAISSGSVSYDVLDYNLQPSIYNVKLTGGGKEFTLMVWPYNTTTDIQMNAKFTGETEGVINSGLAVGSWNHVDFVWTATVFDVKLNGTTVQSWDIDGFAPDTLIIEGYSNAHLANSYFDNIEIIPEPATLGLVGIAGSALFAVRRKFMI